MKKKTDVYLVQEGVIWSTIQASCANTIVQIFAHIGQFDWCQPYRIESQYENFGSGFLIDEEGHIITNAHVIENAKYVWIQIPVLGRQKLEVTVVGICPDRDIALLKISDEGVLNLREALGQIPYVQLGDSDAVQNAESVLVLGYPLGQYHVKSTTGVVSGKEFVLNGMLLQITAPVNPGNSGGPVFNAQGQVIGIAVAVAVEAQNVGYATPVNELKIILDELHVKKIVRKLHLGIRFVDAGDEKARFFGNPLPAGLYIAQVFPGFMCARAGVQSGDMLYGFNGYVLDAYGETDVPWSPEKVSLYDLISRVVIGDTVTMVIYRAGQKKDINFTVEDNIFFAVRRKFPEYENVAYDTIAGLVVMELSENHIVELLPDCPELIRFRQPENRINPVLIITHIVPGSYAYQMQSLEVGNIVVAVNGMLVSTLDEWKKALEKSVEIGFLVLTTEHAIVTVFLLETILADEVKLSNAFAYPISDIINKLRKNNL
jgi:serine protease Do